MTQRSEKTQQTKETKALAEKRRRKRHLGASTKHEVVLRRARRSAEVPVGAGTAQRLSASSSGVKQGVTPQPSPKLKINL